MAHRKLDKWGKRQLLTKKKSFTERINYNI